MNFGESFTDAFAAYKKLSLIFPGYYLSGYTPVCKDKVLKESNVTHILTVADLLTSQFPDLYKYKIVEIDDDSDQNIRQHFEKCFAFIDEALSSGGTIVVHCFAGVSRSATITIAYLMFKKGMTYLEAHELVASKRAIIMPNPGFVKQLEDYELELSLNK